MYIDMEKVFPKPKSAVPMPLDDKPAKAAEYPEQGIGVYESISQVLVSTLTPDMLEDQRVVKFIDSYVACRNINEASKEAGITSSTGYKWRNDVNINNCIVKLTNLSISKYGFDAEEVLARVKEIATVDPVAFLKEDGSYKDNLNDVPPEVRRAVKKFKVKNVWDYDINGIKTVTGQIIEVEFWDKIRTVELLGKEKGLFKETHKIEHDITGNMKDLLLASANRAEEQARLAREARDADTIDITPDNINTNGTPSGDKDETK